jgi:DinB superfamily
MSSLLPEPWLRGPLPGIPALLQPVAHALVMAREDVEAAVRGVSVDQVWMSPSGVTPLGFHVAHLSGSTDRLLTYARGQGLDAIQKAALLREGGLAAERPSIEGLLAEWQATVDRALAQLAATPESTLGDARAVGRAQLPSTVLGLLFHAAEHAARHTGQIVTTARLVRAVTAAQAP